MIQKDSKTLLEVRGLTATVNGVEILKGMDLTVKSGEVHAIMGPNGSGKSTFAKVLAGLLAPTADQPIALAYVQTQYAQVGTRLNAMVRGKAVPMEVSPLPFVPNRYHRG